MLLDDTRVEVVCERVLSGNCSKITCAAYNKNTLSKNMCAQLPDGRFFYSYTCSHMKRDKDGNYEIVKLLDINWKNNKDPNFLFKMSKINF